MLSLTNNTEIDTNPELYIKVQADKANKILHIIDTGIGMTREDLSNNLGTIAKSGTADFLSKVQENSETNANDMIGQFGVGFYSAFLVADRVVVTTKHNADVQSIWESDSSSFSIIEDPRGDTLKRGSQISLYLKDEAVDFLEEDTVKGLIKKYSQFINFPIYLWSSKTVEEEEPIPDEKPEKSEDEVVEDGDEDAKVRNIFMLDEHFVWIEYTMDKLAILFYFIVINWHQKNILCDWIIMSLYFMFASGWRRNWWKKTKDKDREKDSMGLGIDERQQTNLDP